MAEIDRLKALKSTNLLDTVTEERFDRIVRLASGALNTEIALISLVDQDRQWFKAKSGLEALETPREQAFCDHTIKQQDVMIVLDATLDSRFDSNPLVTGDPNIAFYAGAPLITKEGYALGSLCVIDSKPRASFSKRDQQMLKDLAATVMTEVELASQSQINTDLSLVNSDLSLINEELQHRMGNMYAHISALINMLARTDIDKKQFIQCIREKISSLSEMQSLLAKRNYTSVPISELATAILNPFQVNNLSGKIDIQSYDDFDVSARGAFILTLMINELGTNAIKHGALGQEDGHVELSWTNGEEVVFSWKEHGYATQVKPQNSDGFGSQILKRIVPMDLQGIATYDLQPEGLNYTVSARSSRVKFSKSDNEIDSLNLG